MDLILRINLCGKDGYPKFKVKETASEGVKESPSLYIESQGQDQLPDWPN